MTRKRLLQTTAILAFSGFPALAQEAAPPCDEGVLPCLTSDGRLIETREGNEDLLPDVTESAGEMQDATDGGADAEATAETEAETSVETEAGSAAADAAEAALDAAVEAAEEGTEAAAEAAETVAEEVTEETQEAVEATEEALDEAVQAETAAEAEAEVEVEAEAEAEADASSDEGRSTTEVEADTTAETDAVADTSDGTMQDEADTSAEVETPPAAEAETETEAAIDADGRPAAAAAEADEGAVAEVETETVTEETARSSDEDFETDVTGEARAEAEESEAPKKGLSTFEKAVLTGLGAVIVGEILNNGDEVVSSSGDRIVVERDGELRVLKDDDALLRRPGTEIRTETFADGSTRTTATRRNGAQIVTIRAADGTVLRRTRISPDGERIVLFDDTEAYAEVEVSALPEPRRETVSAEADEAALRAALAAESAVEIDRRFSLNQVRRFAELRELAPTVDLDTVTFATGSAAIESSQADELVSLGRAIEGIVREDPAAVFLVEGHTDAVGNAGYNLALSDRRAESVALALTEYFEIPPENLVTQGYGEAYLKVKTPEAERRNRRAVVRNITPLLR